MSSWFSSLWSSGAVPFPEGDTATSPLEVTASEAVLDARAPCLQPAVAVPVTAGAPCAPVPVSNPAGAATDDISESLETSLTSPPWGCRGGKVLRNVVGG